MNNRRTTAAISICRGYMDSKERIPILTFQTIQLANGKHDMRSV